MVKIIERDDFEALQEMMKHVIESSMAGFEERLEGKMDTRLDSMQHEVNACKLERDSISLLIKEMDQLEKRMGKLKQKTA